MPRVIMLQTALGATQHFHPKPYFKGKIYNLDADLAYSFIRQGLAVLEKDETEKYDTYTPQSSPNLELEKKIIKPVIRRGRPPKAKDEKPPIR